jgi:molecular chaperone HscB
MLQEEEKYELSSDFLMEVMEINEAIMDAEVYTSKSDLLEKIETLESEIYAPVKNSIENYQEGVTSEAELLQVKDYYFKKKYIDRIKRELKD